MPLATISLPWAILDGTVAVIAFVFGVLLARDCIILCLLHVDDTNEEMKSDRYGNAVLAFVFAALFLGGSAALMSHALGY